MNVVSLNKYSNGSFCHGRNLLIRLLWVCVSSLIFQTSLPYPSSLKSFLLRIFGAKVGVCLVIRNRISIKQPWRLEIGDHVWIGEGVWIDNLVKVKIGNNVCISQGSMLLTGNHNYTSKTFNLITGEIVLEDGVWIGAKCLVGPAVNCQSHSVLAAASTTFRDLVPYGIYQGNPSVKIRERRIFE